MKRQAAVLVSGAMVAAAVAAWWPRHVEAALCSQPSVSSVSPNVANPGDTVTITGSNFTSVACRTSANIGGVDLTQNQMSVQANSISFTAQAGMHGGVQVALTDISNNRNVSNANVAFYTVPTVAGLSTTTPAAGEGVSVAGSGFAFTVPSGDERLSAAYLSSDRSTCAGASAALSSDAAIAVSAPGHFCDGPLALAISAPADLGNPVSLITVYSGDPGSIDVRPTVTKLSGSTGIAGSPVDVDGSGFGNAGSATVGGGDASSSWSDTSVAVSVPDTAVNNSSIALKRAADGAAISVPSTIAVVARVDGVSPSSASPGDAVTIGGGGFGTDPGTVTLGSTKLDVTGWSPTSIALTLPAGSQTGSLTITPVDTDPPAAQPGLTVVPKLSLTPSGGGTGSPSSASAKPLTPDQVQQVTAALSAPPPPLPPAVVGGTPPALPPTHPTNGLVTLALKAANATATPGKTVPFVVTLKAAGNPVVNAPVQMVIAYEPAADGSVTPTSGVTDSKGEFRGTLHLSKTPGEMIVLARAGEFSDEVRVLGSTANTAAHTSAGSSAAGTVAPTAIAVIAALLIVTGIVLRLWLLVGSERDIRMALMKERIARLPMLLWRRAPTFRTPWSRRDVQPSSNAPAELEVPPQAELAAGLDRLRTDTAPDET